MAMKKGTFSVSCTIALVLSIAVIADAQTFFQNGRFGKRSDLRLRVAGRSDERFFGGPRFGRSNGIAPSSSELDARNSERFFIGSRYGKRSEQEQVVPPAPQEDVSDQQEKVFFMECISVGVEQLYHCEKRNNHFIKFQEEP